LGVDPDTGLPFVGADDNASGISILIEVAAKLARSYSPQRPIIFVAFTAEESGLLGSEYFINNPPAGLAAEDMFAMINLDTVGRLEGRILQIFSTESAYEWPFMAQGIGFTIGVNSTFPADTIASSDHVNFLNAGIPAIHLFAGLHSDYHQTSDTIEKLDAVGMSDISLWLEEATVYLADLADPLRVNLGGENIAVRNVAAGERAASLGTVPDFAFSGEGIRITGVSPEGAGEKAGLIAGDILLTYNGEPMGDLQNYSNLLRASAPGDNIQIEVLRGEEIISVEAILQAR
jgi:aminopeptidase N